MRVYAKLRTGPIVPVSPVMSYAHAVDLHDAMHGRSPAIPQRGRVRPNGYTRPIVGPGYSCLGIEVQFFMVREDDLAGAVQSSTWPVERH